MPVTVKHDIADDQDFGINKIWDLELHKLCG
jgi:hypothetical protein